MKVKCITTFNKQWEIEYKNITKNEIYQVMEEDEETFLIYSEGRKIRYKKEFFEVVGEPKFKIGDKVVKSSGEEWIDEESQKRGYARIKDYRDGLYKVFDSFIFENEDLELYKEVEEMKTFEEVILNSEVGQIWEGETYIIKINANGKVIQRRDKKDLEGNTIVLWDDTKFKLQRKKYTFVEAFALYEEGKEIENVFDGFKFKKTNTTDITVANSLGIKNAYSEDSEIFTVSDIRGEWFVNN